MIEHVMLFSIGFLAAALLSLAFAPLLHSRAVLYNSTIRQVRARLGR